MAPPDRRALLRAAVAFALSGAGAAAASGGPSAAAANAAPGPATIRRRHYVDARFGQLHVTTTGPTAPRAARLPPVCCLPMSPRSGRDFDEFAAHLADRRLVLCPDVPGYGGSDPPPAPPSIADYAAAVLEGLERMAPRGRAAGIDLVGQHTGAAIAVEMALQAPRRVRRLVLVGVPMFDDRERDELRRSFARPRPYFEDPEFVGATWKRDVAAIREGLSQDAMLMRFTEILRAGPRSWWGFNAVFDYPMRERVSRVRQPVLTVALNERLAAATREAATLAVDGRCAEVPDLSGAALDFAAGRLAAIARDFLDAGETATRPG